MKRYASLAVLGGLLTLPAGMAPGAGASSPAGQTPVPSNAGPTTSVDEHRTLINRYCVTCHSQRLKTGSLVLEGRALDAVAADAATWEKVIRKVRTGSMPPVGLPRPTAAAAASLIRWLESTLDDAASKAPNPGRPAIHRLNRAEYTNAVRDLLVLDIDGAQLLPNDDASYGFDNIGEVLTVTPGLLERYLLAAKKVARLATGDATLRASVATYMRPISLVQDARMNEDLPFGTRGGLAVRHAFPVDGMYVLRVRLHRNGLAVGEHVRGLVDENLIDVLVDGQQVTRFTFGGSGAGKVTRPSPVADEGLEVRFPVKAGTRSVGVTFVDQFFYMEGVAVSRLPAGSDGFASPRETSVNSGKVQAAVESISIAGPFEAVASLESPSQRRVFVCRPASQSEERPCALTILSNLATRAYRRPPAAEDMATLMQFYARAATERGFVGGIQAGIERILVSPSFLFRVEDDPAGVRPGSVYRINDVDLASRLSFFLWSSIPDQELLDAAVSHHLQRPKELERQVRRMLGDPKARALVSNFFSQWLHLRNVDAVKPDTYLFPEFDENLRDAFRQETELFVESQLRDDRPMLELFTANYTFANERLSKHYGFPGVYGSGFRRIALPDGRRSGLLGHGSILTVTSYANRTSPVKRGNWILENLLGAPPPPPPPDVPAFEETAAGSRPKTMRERMSAHRTNAVCASCHNRIDPLGLALENFDGIGQFRASEGGTPIDVTGAFPNGATFGSLEEFRRALLTQGDEVRQTIIEKLLTYAMGRGVEAFDMPAVRAIQREAASTDYRWSAVFLAIVKSAPFQMRRAES